MSDTPKPSGTPITPSVPPSKPPSPPRLKAGGLPEVDPTESIMVSSQTGLIDVNESTDLSQISESQLYELNQNLLDEASDVSRPLIDDVIPLSELRKEYEKGSAAFVKQIDWLQTQKGYTGLRRTRGDGDCFYRSVAFAYVERILHAPDQDLAVASALSILKSSLPVLESVGFQKIVFEDFYEVLETLVQSIAKPDSYNRTLDTRRLLAAFQDPESSNAIVVYLRLLTSAHIRSEPLTYEPFLFHPELGLPMTAREFCESFVEAVGKEADHVQMTALSKALQLNVKVAYLDGRDASGAVDFVEFENAAPNGQSGTISTALLYRPGHYDILLGPNDKK